MRVVFGEFVFDSETHELRRGNEPLRLSRKAFTLLEVLVARRPAAVPQQELYDALWPRTFVEMANLHNLVSQLRSVLGDEGHEMIRTVYGVGFSFAAAAAEVTTGAPTVASSPWTLITDDDEFFLPVGEVVVGRGGECGIRIRHATMSRRHALLSVTRSTVLLEDLDSHNGTFVNGSQIRESFMVTTQDEIRFGNVRARLATDGSTLSEEMDVVGRAGVGRGKG